MTDGKIVLLERFLNQNRGTVQGIRASHRTRWIFVFSPKLRRLYAECRKEKTPEEENAALAAFLNAFEEGWFWKTQLRFRLIREDLGLFFRHAGKRKIIDLSDRKKKDDYSIVVIVRNEARYIKEFILFYLATGADRIYLYDNDSTDGLFDVIAPFVRKGVVIYRKWPGQTVQMAAYRDAVRRARRRTKWLAIIDADEFLFSPKGKMPEQLRAYEQYPGIGVNWLMYGPNGHNSRPEGLVMDAYTSTHKDYNAGINCHVKCIVQPGKVFTVHHPHFAVYKKKQFAVGEDGAPLDSFTTRAFSWKNNHEIFRINHYVTKSLDDLKEKCRKGRPDGSPDPDYNDYIRQFNGPMTEDYTIKPFADIVRKSMGGIE